VICRLLKGRQHEYAIFHFCHTKTGDTQNFALWCELARDACVVKETSLIRHDISKEHDVARIDAHAMRGHGVLDFIDDCLSSRFYTQDLGHFHDVIRGRMFAHNAWGVRRWVVSGVNLTCPSRPTFRYHYLLQAIAFNKKLLRSLLASVISFVLDIDHGARY
jgi:hypothetical protein